MCCPGCQAVAEAIVNGGMEDYYRYRTEPGAKASSDLEQTLDTLKAYDTEAFQQEFVAQEGDEKQIQLSIDGIHCAACGWLIEKQLAKMAGVMRVAVNVTARRATISWDPQQLALSQILTAIENIGYNALPFHEDSHEAMYRQINKNYLQKLGLSGLMTMQVMMIAIGLYFGVFGYIEPETKLYLHWTSLVLSTPVVLYAGFGFYKSAWIAIKARTLNMDVSISLALLGTYFASAYATVSGAGEIYFESVCMFVFLLLVSRFIEHKTRYRAAQISANMLKLLPATANLLEDGKITSILVKSLQTGHQVRVRSGETVPVDGTVLGGSAEIDESMLTGEFVPVHKHSTSEVFGGSVVVQGSVTIEVSKTVKHSLINQIIRLQELALADKPRIASFADKATEGFVGLVLLIAAISYVAWQFIDPPQAFWIAIAVLVATCPCALGLATPSALTFGLANLNRRGILVRHANALEKLATIDTVVLDKTGTLTEGNLSLNTTQILVSDLSQQDILSIACALESHSEHPIARAFEAANSVLTASEVSIFPGKGVEGTINGKVYRIGSAGFMHAEVPENARDSILLEDQERLLGCFELGDTLRDDAAGFLAKLEEKDCLILSGDSQTNVASVARQLNIATFYAGRSPQGKLDVITGLQSSGHTVLMSGDGINDAPVLAQADVSVAVGNASDITRRSADIILLHPGLEQIAVLFSLSKRVMRTIKQNMLWAVGYNVLILPLAVVGWLAPWMAVIGMSLSAIIVVLNSTQLLKVKD